MRGLTDAEARIIAVLLGGAPMEERERLRRLKLPRSTYHAARRRAYEERWVEDRYVPDPARFGRPRATFLLSRPYLDKVGRLEELLSSRPEVMHLWGSAQVSLGVAFHPDDGAAREFVRGVTHEGLASWTFPLTANVEGPGVPVYFDFEGLWTHMTDFEGTLSYPLGLGGALALEAGDDSAITDHQRWATAELLHRPFVAEAQGRPSHLVGPLGLPFSQQRMLRLGWVSHRVFLDVARTPAYKGRQGAQVVFITGQLSASTSPQELFATLTRDCRVYPFLFAVRDGRVLLGALGSAPGPTTAPTENLGARRPVMATLRELMQGIEVVQESSTQLSAKIDHRYDRLMSRRSVN
ncbi:MAG: hypothetical protein WCA77_07025 [Thermoplasmata archaeon]